MLSEPMAAIEIATTGLDYVGESFVGFGSMFIDIIAYGGIFRDKRLQTTISPDFVVIMFSRMSIFVVCLKINLDSMGMVEIAH